MKMDLKEIGWTGFFWLGDKCQALENTLLDLWAY
jgi:hypothetical protein